MSFKPISPMATQLIQGVRNSGKSLNIKTEQFLTVANTKTSNNDVSLLLDCMVTASELDITIDYHATKEDWLTIRPMTPDEMLRRDVGQPKQNLINYARVVTGHQKSKEDYLKLADLLTEEHEQELNSLLEGVTLETEVLTILLNYGYAKGLLS